MHSRNNNETDSQELDLVTGQSVSLTDLGVTPQTVFISPRTIGVDAKADLKRLRPHLVETSASRRTSFASRSARGGIDNPLDEIRKRLASLEPMTPRSDKTSSETAVQPDASPSESAISSSIDLAQVRRAGRKKLDAKAAPAVGASYTVALGTASIHDDLLSGRTTPLAEGQSTQKAAPYSSSYEGHDPGVRTFLEQVDLENYREPLLDFGPRVTVSHRKRPPKQKSNAPQNVTMIAHLTQHSGPVVSIVTSPDHVFFATASSDSQVLVWDSARLERSVSAKARLIYRMDAPISSMCSIENTHCLAVAAEDGQLHVLRVHVTGGSSARYGKIECIRTWAAERRDGHVLAVSHLRGGHIPTRLRSSADPRIISAFGDYHLCHCTFRYQNNGNHDSVPTPHRIRRHHSHLPFDALDRARHGFWLPVVVGFTFWSAPQILASVGTDNGHFPSSFKRQRSVDNGVNEKEERRAGRRGL